jgi:hypothetical protein
MREVETVRPTGARAGMGATSSGWALPRTERLAVVRPRAAWQELTPAGQARIRQTFVRVLLEALGAAAGAREVGRDAPRR